MNNICARREHLLCQLSHRLVSEPRLAVGQWIRTLTTSVPTGATAHRFIAIFQDKYILKLFDNDIDSVEKELRMMLLAGDCSVIPLGLVFKEGKLYGIIMPYETPVVPPSPDPTYTPLVSSELSRSDRLRIINLLRLLLSLLH